jgi:hypothetical protein
MIILRLARDIRRHFPIRVPEWIMAAVLLGWSFMLSSDPDTFQRSADFAELARYGDEIFWSTICLLVALLRLVALIVNGTFHQFRYAPHLPASLRLSPACSGGKSLGVFIAWLGGAPGTGVVAYIGYMAFEGWNLFRAAAYAAAARRAR